jgi:hypothetical protein
MKLSKVYNIIKIYIIKNKYMMISNKIMTIMLRIIIFHKPIMLKINKLSMKFINKTNNYTKRINKFKYQKANSHHFN